MTPFTEAPQTTNPAGSAVQSAAAHPGRRNRRRQRTGVAVGADLPDAAESRNARRLLHGDRFGVIDASEGLLGVLGLSGPLPLRRPSARSGTSLIGELLYLPAFFGAFVGLDALSPIMGNLETAATTPVAPVGDEGAAGAAGARGCRRWSRGWRRQWAGFGVRRGLRSLGQRGRRAFVGRVVGAAELGYGRRHHLRRRCCFPTVCRWRPQTPA